MKLTISCPSCKSVQTYDSPSADAGLMCPQCRSIFSQAVASPATPELTHTAQASGRAYEIKFGTASAVDKFGFVGRGTLTITDIYIRMDGRKRWSALAQLGIFLALTLAPYFLFGFGLGLLGFILALIIINFWCASPASIQWPRRQVQDMTVSGKKISFSASDPESGKLRKALFRASDATVATDIAAQLNASTDIPINTCIGDKRPYYVLAVIVLTIPVALYLFLYVVR